MSVVNDQLIACKLPSADVAIISQHAKERFANANRQGPKGRFSYWLKRAIVTQAKIDGLELEILPYEMEQKRRLVERQAA